MASTAMIQHEIDVPLHRLVAIKGIGPTQRGGSVLLRWPKVLMHWSASRDWNASSRGSEPSISLARIMVRER